LSWLGRLGRLGRLGHLGHLGMIGAALAVAGCGFEATASSPPPTTIDAPGLEASSPVMDAPSMGSDAPAVTCAYPTILAFGGHHYRLTTAEAAWDAGRASCEGDGGHLARIESKVEDDFLSGVTSIATKWIGGHDTGTTALSYHWDNGDAIAFANWDDNEPGVAGGCVGKVGGDGSWFTATCTTEAIAICECDR
jgi:hypothetical protein